MKSNVSKVAVCALSLAAASQASIVARGQVTIEDRTLINGDIQAGLGGRLGTGNGSKVNGDITTCGDFILRDGAAFQNLFYQGALTKGQRLTYTSINPITNCQRVAAPVVTVTSGTTAVNVGIAQTVEIQPGKYGAVYVGSQKATLRFKAGTYEIYSLRTEPDAHLEFEKGVILKVAANVDLGDRTKLQGVDVTNTVFEVKGAFSSGTDMLVPMKIVAGDKVTMKDRTSFNDIYANMVVIMNDCNGLAGPPAPKKVLFFDDFGTEATRTSTYIGDAYGWATDPVTGDILKGVPKDSKLKANWKISTGSIDVVSGAYASIWVDATKLTNQSWFVDLVGSMSSDLTATTLETVNEFPAGNYQISLKLAGSNRKDKNGNILSNTATATVQFGSEDMLHEYHRTYLEPFSPETYTISIKAPARLKIIGSNEGNMAGLLLDDVEIRQLD